MPTVAATPLRMLHWTAVRAELAVKAGTRGYIDFCLLGKFSRGSTDPGTAYHCVCCVCTKVLHMEPE